MSSYSVLELDARLYSLQSRRKALDADQARQAGDSLRADLLKAESSLLALRAKQIEFRLRSMRCGEGAA
jgi:hypothetical protein